MSNDPMLEMFIFENMQLTERLEEVLIEGEQLGAFNDEHINEIFRIMHTIKGSAAMMEYTHIATLGHSVEDMFYYIREHDDVNADWSAIADLCLESADFFKQEVAKIQQGQPSDGDETPLLVRIHAYMDILTGKVTAPVEASAAAPAPEPQEVVEEEYEDEDEAEDEAEAAAVPVSDTAELLQGEHVYTARIFFEDGCKMENIRAYQITNTLMDICSRIDSKPTELLDDCSDEIIKNGVTLVIYTSVSYEQVRSIINDALFVKSFELNEGGTLLTTAPEPEFEEEAEPVIAPPPAPEPVPVPPPAPEPVAEEKPKKGKKKKEAAAPAPQAEPVAVAEPIPEPVVTAAPAPAPAPVAAAPAPAPTPAPAAPVPAVKAAPAPVAAAAKIEAAAPVEVKQSFISVNVEKLDKLMDLMGEIVISTAMVVSNPDLAGLQLDNFEKAAGQLLKNTNELQDVIMSVRMIPISSTFHKMHRIVRDTSRKLGKEVELVILGEETEVDKNIIDNLSDPLMHIIRNSMDHGIEETREARENVGKPAAGKIILEARNSGSDVIISCTDDGRGLDRDKILAKAARNGMLTKPENDYTDKEAYYFIMAAGFSTNEEVTELSGRGVGMDVVKKNIEKIGGNVLLDSTPGEGMTVTIRIPLTLAILQCIEIRVGKNLYLIPTLNIRESFKPKKEDIVIDPEGNEMILFRGECYSIVRLHSLFAVHTEVSEFEDGIIIMIEDEGRMAGIFADRLVGEQQVVVKPLPAFITERIGQIRGVSGCSILGDGSISLIIDVKSLTQ